MATSLTQYRTKVQTYLRDPGNDHWSQTQIDEAVGVAVNQMWRVVRAANDDALTLTAFDYTWPANQESVALTDASVFNTNEVWLREVMQYANTTHDLDTTYDIPTPLAFVPFRYRYHDDNYDPGPELYPNSYGDGWYPGQGGSSGVATCVYSLQGAEPYLYLIEASAIPRRAIKLRLYAHVPWSKPTTGNDEPLPEAWDVFHEFVVFTAVMLLKGQSDEDIQHVMYQHAEIKKQIEAKAADLYTAQGELRVKIIDA